MNKVLSIIILLFITITEVQTKTNNTLTDEGLHYTAAASGKTTGHIGDLTITNQSNSTQTVELGSFLIPPENGKQGFVVFKESQEKTRVKAGESYTHKLYGYCVNVNLSPPDEGEAFPDYTNWFPAKNIDSTFVYNWHRDDNPIQLNFTTQLKETASILIDALNNLDAQYKTWKKPLQIPDLYPEDLATKEAVIQQTIWQFASAIQGKIYSFQQFEQSILAQPRVKDWMNRRGPQSSMVNGESIRNKTYFNYQCQQLWHIVSELNRYVNPGSKQIITQRKMDIGDLETKQIQFQDVWANVNLTGLDFKINDNSIPPKTSTIEDINQKKTWLYTGSGITVASIIIAILLNNKEGCTDPTACNFDEKAKKDDMSCEYEKDCNGICGGNAMVDCEGVCDGNSISGSLCDNARGKFNEYCDCMKFDCNSNEGQIKFCSENNKIKLIEVDGKLFEMKFDTLVQQKFACSNTNSAFFEGQTIKFDYYELDEMPDCNEESDKKIMVTCLELIETQDCNFKTTVKGKIIKPFSCDDFNTDVSILINSSPSFFIIPIEFDCSTEIYEKLSTYEDRKEVLVDFEIFNFETPCSNNSPEYPYVIVTCLEPDTGMLKQKPNLYNSKGFVPTIENRLITIPIQNSEYPETTVITNILGIQYNQPLNPTLFIENQGAAGYVPASDQYFLNNKITLNAKNPHFPIHYGVGFNSLQLSEIPNLVNWQNELIWNVGLKVPLFKIFRLEAEVFKSFDIEDAPNYSIRLIYTKGKGDDEP